MKRTLIVVACAGLVLSAQQAFAQRGNGGSKPKPPTVSKPTTPTVKTQHGPKAPAPKPTGAKAKTTTTSPKSAAGSNANTKKPTTDTTAASTKSSEKSTSSAPTTTSTTTAAGDGPGTTVPLTPVQQKLQRNTNLADKLQGRLPLGTDLMTAAAGFRNLGQFVAAVNVSNNLGITFTELKTRMVDDGLSLGQAIQKSKTTSDPYVQAQQAEYDAQRMIAESESSQQPTSSSTSTTKAKKRTQGGVR